MCPSLPTLTHPHLAHVLSITACSVILFMVHSCICLLCISSLYCNARVTNFMKSFSYSRIFVRDDILELLFHTLLPCSFALIEGIVVFVLEAGIRPSLQPIDDMN